MPKRRKISSILGAIIIVLYGIGYLLMNFIVDKANRTVIQPIDVSILEDGAYIGAYEITPVQVEVLVEVQNQTMQEISILKHIQGFGEDAQNIVEDVIQKQSLEVDTISGATVSSKCILKAIEQAIVKENVNE